MAEIVYNVKNRSTSRVGYAIPEDNIRRTFAPGETKRITHDELMKLSYQPGGREMMVHFLQIQSDKELNELNIKAQPEYYMSEQQVVELLKNGSIEAFLDCLDFAPIGVIDLVKKLSVSLPLTDMNKRKALKDKTGFDVDKAISMAEPDAPAKVAEPAAPVTAAAAPTGRRTAADYKAPAKPASK